MLNKGGIMSKTYHSSLQEGREVAKVCLTQLETFSFGDCVLWIVAMNQMFWKYERRRDDYVDINFYFLQQTNSTRKEYEFPFI